MKKLLLSLTFLVSLVSFAKEKPITRYKCTYKISETNESEVIEKIEMSGVIELEDGANLTSYLSLEPPVTSDLDVTARVLLSRHEGEDYFPMTLHPRGDTADYLKHSNIKGLAEKNISFQDGNLDHSFICRADVQNL